MADLTAKIDRIAANVADTYAVLAELGTDLPETANAANLASAAAGIKAVLYGTAQQLTDSQKQQARDNIGAGTSEFSGAYGDLTDVPGSFTPAAHSQGAATVTAGTFAGQVKANASGQAPGESLVRNIKLSPTDVDPTVEGEVVLMFG